MKKLILALYIIYLPFQLKFLQLPVTNMINVNFFLALLILILLLSKSQFTTRPKFEKPLMIFIIIWSLSVFHTIFSPGELWIWLVITDFKRLITLILGYFVFSRCLKTEKEVRFLFYVFLTSIVLVGLHTWRNGVLGGIHFSDAKRSAGPFGIGFYGADVAGGFLAMFSPFVLAYFLLARRKISKILSFLGFIICLIGLFTTYSRGSILSFSISVIVIIIVSIRRLLKQSKIFAILLLLGLLFGIINWRVLIPDTIIDRITKTFINDEYSVSSQTLDESSKARIQRWRVAIDQFKSNPIFGAGYTQSEIGALNRYDTHNGLILILVEMGIIGFLVFLWFLFGITKEAAGLLNTKFDFLGLGFIGNITALILVNMFYANFFRDTVVGSFWIVLGILSTSKKFIAQKKIIHKNRHFKIVPQQYIIILTSLICLFFSGQALAGTDSRWWNEKEISTLNVLKDLNVGRLGRNLYVDGINGDDVNGDGASFKPWKTIKKGVSGLSPGDVLSIAAGIYHERIWITKSGTEENRIIIGPYGNGEVIIDASQEIKEWFHCGENIYKAYLKFKPTAIVVDETPLFPEFSLNNMREGKWYYDDKAKILYLHILDGSNPALHNVGIISNNSYQDAVFINCANHITLYGLTVRYSGGKGISILGDHNTVEKCNVKFNGGTGISMFSYNNIPTINTIIIKNNIFHNFLSNWPRGRYKSGGWGAGANSQGTPNTQFIGNIVHKNGGEGLLAYSGKGGTLFRDNIVYDNWSVNIYIDNQPNGIIDSNLIFCHDPDPEDLYNNDDKNPGDGKNLRRLRAEGIMTADEKYNLNPPANLKNITVTNNVIIGCRRGITHYGQAQGSGLKNILVAHNTVIVPDAKGYGEDYIGIGIPYNNDNNNNAIYSNNIIYASHPDTYLLSIDTGPMMTNDRFHGLTFKDNLWYHKNNLRAFHVGKTDIDFKNWLNYAKKNDHCLGDIFQEPKLLDATKHFIDAIKLIPDFPTRYAGIFNKER